jgi:hypothetical protein
MNSSTKDNLAPKSSNSNTWSYLWDFDYSFGEAIITDPSCNVYIAGRIYSYPENKIFNIKYDKNGFKQWNVIWSLNEKCSIADMALDNQSNMYNLVQKESESLLMKINSSGFSEWNKTIEGTAECMYIDKFDNIYIYGDLWNLSSDEQYIYLKKIDQYGKSIWNNSLLTDDLYSTYSFYSSHGLPRTIIVDDLNQTYAGGLFFSSGFPGESTYYMFGSYIPAPYAYISIYDSSGILTSFKKWRISEYYITINMVFDNFCNLYLMGADKSISHNTLLKYNSSGILQFSTNWHNKAIERIEFWYYIAQDTLNNTYCAGENFFWDGKVNYIVYYVKFNNQGIVEWDGECDLYYNAGIGDLYIDSNFSVYLTGQNAGKMMILKNPILSPILDPFYINIELTIILSSIFSIWGLAGIFFYVYVMRNSPKKVRNRV